MALKTRAQIASDITTALADNTSGAITPAVLRTLLTDLYDSTGPRTIDVWTAHLNSPPATGFMTLDTNNSHPALIAVDSADTAIVRDCVVPVGANLSGGIAVDIWWYTSGTTGNIRLRASIERTTTALTTDSFDTTPHSGSGAANSAANGTANVPTKLTLTLSSIDGLLAGEPFRLKVEAVRTDTTNDTLTASAGIIRVHTYTVA